MASISAAPLNGIHQQTARPWIQRKRHGVDSEVAPPQVFDDRARRDDWRLPRLFVALGSGCADLGAHVALQYEVKSLQIVVCRCDHCACVFELFLQLEGIALNREVKVANGKPADDVANRTAGQVNVHARVAGNILHQRDPALLVGSQPDFHGVNVIGHALLRTWT